MSATPALAAAPIATSDEPARPDNAKTVTEATAPAPWQPTTTETPAAQLSEDAPPVNRAVGAAHPTVSAPAPSERDQALTRIRQSTLPPALRDRLAAVVEAGQSPSLDVAVCLEALEETLPDFLRGHRNNVTLPAHPSGNAFFQGGDGELTDAEAETLAQRQLARSGLLRGQGVKVAD
jgi:hypothetical protein